MNSTHCRFCNGVDFDELTQYDERTKQTLLWRSCSCGFVSQLPYSNDVEQVKAYGIHFDILDPEFKPWHDWDGLVKSCEHNANLMDKYKGIYPQRRYLEIAAFSGFLMEQMRRRGWNVRGQELTQHGCDEGANHGLPIECASVFNWEPNAVFDIISMREFIEHVWDFRELVARCYRWQAPDGMLWIQTPITDEGIDFKRKLSFQPDHVSLFSMHNLRSVLTLAGYTVLNAWNHDGCGIVQAVKRVREAGIEKKLETDTQSVNEANAG